MKNRYEQWGHESFIDNETKEVSGDFIELMNKQNEIIADLEAKLAESEENKLLAENCIKNLTNKIQEKEEDYGYLKRISHELGLQNIDYEKQVALLKSSEKCLAENVKQLKQQLEEEKNRSKKLNHEAQKYYEDAYCNGFQNQTAIAELEKVKELIKEHYNKQFPDFPLGVTEQIHIGIIDQRIKSLKGDK